MRIRLAKQASWLLLATGLFMQGSLFAQEAPLENIEEIPDGPDDHSNYIPVDDKGNEIKNAEVVKENTPLVLPEIEKQHQQQQTGTQLFRSTSRSKQFITSGLDTRLCTSINVLAENIKADLLNILEEKDEWKSTINIELIGRTGEPVRTLPISAHLRLLDETSIYIITVRIGQGIDEFALKMKLLEVLLYERALRKTKTEFFPSRLELPPWLISGLNEALLWKKDEADRHLYATLFDRGDIFSLEKMFEIKSPLTELDGSSLGVYRASSGALMLSLSGQSGGKESLKRMLDQAVFSPMDGATLLKQNFPGLHLSKNSLHKWWALQLSKMAMQPMTECLTMLETDRLLTEYSQVPYYDSEYKTIIKVGPENYKVLMGLPQETRRALLKPMQVNLVQLSYRCFPLQRKVVLDNIVLVESLLKDHLPKDIDDRLLKLKKEREALLKIGTRSRDLVDWYTIVSGTQRMGSFDHYIRAMKLLREKKAPSNNPMSKYLDDIEKMSSQI